MNYHVWDAMLEAYHKLHPKPKSITELKQGQGILKSNISKTVHFRDKVTKEH